MEFFISIPITFTIAVVILCFILYRYWLSKSRAKELEHWAHSHGFKFYTSHKYNVDKLFADFKCLRRVRRGQNHYAYNFITGRVGQQKICAFDYHYGFEHVESKHEQQGYDFSAVVVETGLPLNPLYIRPENTLDKLSDFAGHGDIDFESVEFSNKFYVQSPDRRWAYDVINQEIMDFMLKSPVFSLEFKDSQIIAYRNHIFTVKDFDRALRLVTGIINRMSPSLLKELNLKSSIREPGIHH